MRNILVHGLVQGIPGPHGLDAVIVQGHAQDVADVRVRVRFAGREAELTVRVDPRGHWVARFDHANDALGETLGCGSVVRASAEDPEEPSGCYASVEAEVECP